MYDNLLYDAEHDQLDLIKAAESFDLDSIFQRLISVVKT